MRINIGDRKYTIEEAFRLAQSHLENKQFTDLVDICRRIASADPSHFRAVHGIGLGLHNLGNTDEAIYYIRKAIELNPEYFSAYNNLGNMLRESGDFIGALSSFQEAERLQPGSVMILANIGGVLIKLARIDEALTCFARALELEPEYADALYGKALCLHKKGSNEQARDTYLKVLAVDPAHTDALYALASLEVEMDLPRDAHQHFLQLLHLKPDMYDANLALANFLTEQTKSNIDWARDDALYYYEKASELNPEEEANYITIGNMYVERGNVDDALQSFRKALSINPGHAIARSCLLMSSQYHPSPSMEDLYNESISWPQYCTLDIPRTTRHDNDADPDRPLKIGYVSADFRMHPVGFHLVPAIYHHDPDKFEIFCYSNNSENDVLTKRLKSYAENWREIKELSDAEAHEMIRKDGIDILIDLSGHTGGNRLQLFARKPAPVQATWIGYFFSTGLTEIDYIIMDDTAVLPGEESCFSEKVIRMPQTRFCYEPPPFAGDVASSPCIRNGYVTFGSFNNLAKVTEEVIELWAKVLLSVPDAKLILKSKQMGSESVKSRIFKQFESLGVNRDRLILRGVSPHIDMLAEYGDMDIALDPFPFNGGMTSCEALWMGVPVLTLNGYRPIARQTAGFLKAIGLEEFIAGNKYDYCEFATKLSKDLAKLAEIRQGLRGRMKSSLLCDGKRFTANLEAAYREMWRKWCNN